MRKLKIVADSSSDLISLQDFDFASAPLKITTDQKDFVDDASLDIKEMLNFLDDYKGKSKTSCPSKSI